MLPDALRATLGQYPNLLMHLAGHTHHHQVTVVETDGGTPYWEVETSALADFPNQMRAIEVWDMDNGLLQIHMVGLDYQTENDPIAEEGRRLAIMDFTSGWEPERRGKAEDRNVNLYVSKP